MRQALGRAFVRPHRCARAGQRHRDSFVGEPSDAGRRRRRARAHLGRRRESQAVHAQFVDLGFEGSVLKRRDGRYWPRQRSSLWRKVKARSQCSSVLEVVSSDPCIDVVERVGCRVAGDPQRLTWAVVWDASLRRQLTRELNDAVGRTAVVTYTHRTIADALRETRLTALH